MSVNADKIVHTAQLAPRRHQRTTVRIMAALREAGRHRFEVDIADLSEGGCQLDTKFHMRVGARIWLSFPGLSAVEATILWGREAQYGCRFDPPLHPAIFAHIVKQQGG